MENLSIFKQSVELQCWELIGLFCFIAVVVIVACLVYSAVPKGRIRLIASICIVYYACLVVYYVVFDWMLFDVQHNYGIEITIFVIMSIVATLTHWHASSKTKK